MVLVEGHAFVEQDNADVDRGGGGSTTAFTLTSRAIFHTILPSIMKKSIELTDSTPSTMCRVMRSALALSFLDALLIRIAQIWAIGGCKKKGFDECKKLIQCRTLCPTDIPSWLPA